MGLNPLRTSTSRRCAMLLALVGCGGLEPVKTYDPITDPGLLYMALTLDHRAVNLSTVAPYNTIQLTVTPLNALGAPMSGLPAPTFRSSDTTRVRVTADGRVEALRTGIGIRVIAEIVADGNVRHADTAGVNVTASATPPVLDSLSFPPNPTVSMLPRIFNGFIFLFFGGMGDPFAAPTARAFDTAGGEISGLVFSYESLDPEIGQADGSGIFPVKTGQVRWVARTTAYGVTKSDTVLVTITPPAFQGSQIIAGPDGAPVFEPDEVLLKAGGFMFWFNLSEQPADVTFDDPASATAAPPAVCAVATQFGGDPATFCGEGSIPPFEDTDNELTDVRVRQFNVPGTYTYRTATGATGRIIVSP